VFPAAIDRLSILAVRIYQMEKPVEARRRLASCRARAVGRATWQTFPVMPVLTAVRILWAGNNGKTDNSIYAALRRP
jgi:hypothetical protein